MEHRERYGQLRGQNQGQGRGQEQSRGQGYKQVQEANAGERGAGAEAGAQKEAETVELDSCVDIAVIPLPKVKVSQPHHRRATASTRPPHTTNLPVWVYLCACAHPCVQALLNSYIDNPKDNLKLVYDGDDPQTDAYCAAVILRSTYDQDTADLSAREKDILKRIEGFGSVARVFVLMPDTPDDNVGRFIAAPPHKDDPFQRVQRMILSPHDAQADAAKSSGGAPSSVPQYIKLGVHSVQIVDPQVLFCCSARGPGKGRGRGRWERVAGFCSVAGCG